MQSGCKIQADGAAISTVAFKPEGWITATVPSTVLGAQVAAGQFKNPYFGMNLRGIPGTSYPVGTNYANSAMSPDSPYQCAWWYRKTFSVPAADKGKTQWLRFGGINYRANVWINGKQVADSKQVQGAFQTFEFDVTKYLIAGKQNTLAVETFAPTENDSQSAGPIGVRCLPIKRWGCGRRWTLVTTGPVAGRVALGSDALRGPSLKEADLTVYGEMRNGSDKPYTVRLTATLQGITSSSRSTLAPTREGGIFLPRPVFEAEGTKSTHLVAVADGSAKPGNAKPSLHRGGKTSDEVTTRYGIREMTSELIDKTSAGQQDHSDEHDVRLAGSCSSCARRASRRSTSIGSIESTVSRS